MLALHCCWHRWLKCNLNFSGVRWVTNRWQQHFQCGNCSEWELQPSRRAQLAPREPPTRHAKKWQECVEIKLVTLSHWPMYKWCRVCFGFLFGFNIIYLKTEHFILIELNLQLWKNCFSLIGLHPSQCFSSLPQ